MAYSEEDINSAVAAGALSAEAAASFRDHMSLVREIPRGDEENFRLINSFNDVFVTIGVIILLIAVGSIGSSLFSSFEDAEPLSGTLKLMLPSAAVAGAAWGLAEIFTRRRRMALPSIVLLLAFLGSVLMASLALAFLPLLLITGIDAFTDTAFEDSGITDTLAAIIVVAIIGGGGALTAYAARLHWKRFMVPITIAAGAAAVVGCLIGAIAAAVSVVSEGRTELAFLPIVLAAGIAVFAFAMYWDMSDRERLTRRSDVAFWLHLLAAPMIAHPLFNSLGVMDGGDAVGIAGALGVVAIYILFGVVALVVDRRALLVSALAYVLVALTFLFDKFGAVELNFALTALVIGSALLTLSAYWSALRSRLLAFMPAEWTARVPAAA